MDREFIQFMLEAERRGYPVDDLCKHNAGMIMELLRHLGSPWPPPTAAERHGD